MRVTRNPTCLGIPGPSPPLGAFHRKPRAPLAGEASAFPPYDLHPHASASYLKISTGRPLTDFTWPSMKATLVKLHFGMLCEKGMFCCQ